MFTAAALRDVHTRTHEGLVKLIDHCAGFNNEALDTELEGFGYRSLRLQLHHAIGCEQYWVGVLRGQMLVDESEEDRESIDAIRTFRSRVAAVTAGYLASATESELNTARRMVTWGDPNRSLVPARVILRTQTHIFQHQGQVAAMCRLLGRPIPSGLDFSLD